MTKMAIKNDLAYQSVEQSDKDDDDVVGQNDLAYQSVKQCDKDDDDVVDRRSKKPDAKGRSQSAVAILVNLKMRTK